MRYTGLEVGWFERTRNRINQSEGQVVGRLDGAGIVGKHRFVAIVGWRFWVVRRLGAVEAAIQEI